MKRRQLLKGLAALPITGPLLALAAPKAGAAPFVADAGVIRMEATRIGSVTAGRITSDRGDMVIDLGRGTFSIKP